MDITDESGARMTRSRTSARLRITNRFTRSHAHRVRREGNVRVGKTILRAAQDHSVPCSSQSLP